MDQDYSLTAYRDVEVSGGGFVATSTEPWLIFRGFDASRLADRFIELTYRASLLDEPARPILRFLAADGNFVDCIGAAPMAGAAVWVGRVPARTTTLAISPTNRIGAFGFLIEDIRRRTWPRLVLDGLRHHPSQTRSAVLTRLIGWRPESDNNLAWATGATNLAAFDRWMSRRARALDPNGLDAPRHDRAACAKIRVVVTAGGDADALRRTLDSLRAQAFEFWEALVIDGGAPSAEPDRRIVAMGIEEALDRLGEPDEKGLVGAVEAGETLPSHAFAFLVEQRCRHPDVEVFYGDEIAAGRPVLKPGWCPRLWATCCYLGSALFAAGVDRWSRQDRRRFIEQRCLPPGVAAFGSTKIKPLRRFLLTTPRPFSPATHETPAHSSPTVTAALVILTRDSPALLARLLASIRAKSEPGRYRLVIVDNGMPGGPSARCLAKLETASDVLLLRRPGPFNFSALCNEAAAACDDDLLVFLNDDMEVLSDGWLRRLAAHVFDDGIGAVGARLTFPDGRLQHAGVLVGMGGSAGHFGALAPGDHAGWLGRDVVTHEVSAVTGACLAVARDKFMSVGGFDTAHLPVELSDVDLCLKLNDRGWRTIVDPAVRLMHEESASRGGATLRRLDVYAAQRAVFVSRWRHVLRDDPTFHPGLSLYCSRLALG